MDNREDMRILFFCFSRPGDGASNISSTAGTNCVIIKSGPNQLLAPRDKAGGSVLGSLAAGFTMAGLGVTHSTHTVKESRQELYKLLDDAERKKPKR